MSASSRALPDACSAVTEEASPRLRVLIVDDNEADRELLSRHLARALGAAVEVREEATFAAASDYAAAHRVDLLLTDYRLPDGDGLGLLAAMRRIDPDLAVIVLSGQGNERLAADAIKAGAQDYLSKEQLDPQALKTAVAEALAWAGRRGQQRPPRDGDRRIEREWDHLVKAISHDMSAQFMLLEHSMHEARRAQRAGPGAGFIEAWKQVDACLLESKRFLNDLATLSRTGAIDMAPAAVSADEVAREVLSQQREVLAEAAMEASVDGPLPRLWINRRRLQQVLTNLVRNAARHGAAGAAPRLRIGRPAVDPAPAGFVSLAIEDNGPGIPPEAREEAFLPGRRLPGAHREGSGMGLAIVRRIVEHYGGQVVLSQPAQGPGTAVVFWLPQAPAVQAVRAEAIDPAAGSGSAQALI